MAEREPQQRLQIIGFVRSPLATREQAPKQGSEGAPDVRLEMDTRFAQALDGIAPGSELIVITWLHLADRTVLKVHPRSDPHLPLTGVFATRSPDRPNPLGLHKVTVREVDGCNLLAGPMEAVDGTPIIDIKVALTADG